MNLEGERDEGGGTNYDIRCGSSAGKTFAVVEVSKERGDGWVGIFELGGLVSGADEGGDFVFGMGCGEGFEDGAADVAACAGSGKRVNIDDGELGRDWRVYRKILVMIEVRENYGYKLLGCEIENELKLWPGAWGLLFSICLDLIHRLGISGKHR